MVILTLVARFIAELRKLLPIRKASPRDEGVVSLVAGEHVLNREDVQRIGVGAVNRANATPGPR